MLCKVARLKPHATTIESLFEKCLGSPDVSGKISGEPSFSSTIV